jgi:hypothetical protein
VFAVTDHLLLSPHGHNPLGSMELPSLFVGHMDDQQHKENEQDNEKEGIGG